MAEHRVQRMLATILAFGVVGYSRLIGEHETGTLTQSKTHRKEVFASYIVEYNEGRKIR